MEPRVLAVSKGISVEQARKEIETMSGSIRYWVYHDCCEPPIASMPTPTLPDNYICPECEEEINDSDVVFVWFKVCEVPDPEGAQSN